MTWCNSVAGVARAVPTAAGNAHAVGTGQVLSPVVHSNTSCPAAANPLASKSMTVSVPPYPAGGTATHGGAINPMRIISPHR
jgi:hypothetical protein